MRRRADAPDADDEAAAAVLVVSADAALADASPAFVVAVPALLSADAGMKLPHRTFENQPAWGWFFMPN